MRRRAVDVVARLRGQRPELTLYYQVGDAYSHLCVQLLPALRERLDLDLRVAVIPPIEDATNAAPELGPAYGARDAARIAPAWGLDFPEDAVVPDAEVRALAERVLVGAEDIDAFLAAEPRIAAAVWRNDAQSLAAHDAVDDADERLAANREELQRRGHYQGGMWHFRGEWYWALDRLDYLESRLRGLGLLVGDAPLAVCRPEHANLPPVPRDAALEYFYSFRSPYSYISIERTRRLAAGYGVDLRIRPVLPMVMRGLKVPRAKRLYIAFDTKREADRLGVPFGRVADPLGGGVERCLTLFPEAEAAGRGLDFMLAAGRAIWAEGRDVKRPDVMRDVLRRAGLDPALAERPTAESFDDAEANREALFELGLWGVPSYRLGDLAVWGQDRIWLLDEALRRR